MVLTAGERGLVARDARPGPAAGPGQAHEQIEHPIDAGDADAPAVAAQLVEDLLGRPAALLLGQRRDHGLARAAGAVPARATSASAWVDHSAVARWSWSWGVPPLVARIIGASWVGRSTETVWRRLSAEAAPHAPARGDPGGPRKRRRRAADDGACWRGAAAARQASASAPPSGRWTCWCDRARSTPSRGRAGRSCTGCAVVAITIISSAPRVARSPSSASARPRRVGVERAARQGFRVEGHDLTVHGTCASCRAA